MRSIDAGLDGMDAADAAPERDEQAIDDLRVVESQLGDYLRHGELGDKAAMQKTVWRFLWVDRLPVSVTEAR